MNGRTALCATAKNACPRSSCTSRRASVNRVPIRESGAKSRRDPSAKVMRRCSPTLVSSTCTLEYRRASQPAIPTSSTTLAATAISLLRWLRRWAGRGEQKSAPRAAENAFHIPCIFSNTGRFRGSDWHHCIHWSTTACAFDSFSRWIHSLASRNRAMSDAVGSILTMSPAGGLDRLPFHPNASGNKPLRRSRNGEPCAQIFSSARPPRVVGAPPNDVG